MLNIEQLSTMEDSLKKDIRHKEEQLYKSLMHGNYFKKRTKRLKPKATASSASLPVSARNKKLAHPETMSTPRKIRDSLLKYSINKDSEKPVREENNTKQIENSKQRSDSLNRLTKIAYINSDSIYNNLTLREKSRIAGTALSYARTVKNLVSNSLQSLDYKIDYLRKYEIEWHRKFTYAFACILFLFIGAPLGAIIRKGGLGLPLILSTLFFILHYILSLIGEKLARESILPGYQGMWLSSAIFLVTGAFITYKATTDSSILNIDTYTNFIKNIFGQRYNVVDKLSIRKEPAKTAEAKTDNIHASLLSLNESVDDMLKTTANNLRVTDFLVSIFSIQNDSNLIIFERYYNNTFRAIINHPVFHNTTIRAKVYDFPSLTYKEFNDTKVMQYITAILACIPPLTIIIIVRQYIKITLLRAKLKQIKQLIPELGKLLKISESADKK